MKKNDRSVYSHVKNDRHQMMSRKSCHKLYRTLKPIKFTIQHTVIEIKPEGYVYSLSDSEKDCFIGIEQIPDRSNHYRLGTVFLRNFYVVLNYELNLIHMGINNGSEKRVSANIKGKST